MEINASYTPMVSINAPEWFQEPEFVAWLNDPSNPLMSYHNQGATPSEGSDTLVFVDPGLSGEGSEHDTMPEPYWDKIIEICRDNFESSTGFNIVVRITNIEE